MCPRCSKELGNRCVCSFDRSSGCLDEATENEWEDDQPRERCTCGNQRRIDQVLNVLELASAPDEEAGDEQDRIRSEGSVSVFECGDQYHRVYDVLL
jgi:hypothetical protein